MPVFFNPELPLETSDRYLPHWEQAAVWYFVTWRLADSLPREKLDLLREERRIWLSLHPQPWSEAEGREYDERFFQRANHWLDAGHGACQLRRPECAGIVAEALLFFNGSRCAMETFVVMPNHVHALFSLAGGWTLHEALASWKKFSARKINGLLGRRGEFWQREEWDRIVRNQRHYHYCWEYIRQNPVKAGLAAGEFLLWQKEKLTTDTETK